MYKNHEQRVREMESEFDKAKGEALQRGALSALLLVGPVLIAGLFWLMVGWREALAFLLASWLTSLIGAVTAVFLGSRRA